MKNSGLFSWQRFLRLLAIDFSNYWKRVALASGMVFAGLLFIYSDISDEPAKVFSEGIFILLTMVGGAVFTSVIFNDMHHPLERYQFLTLPCSPLERFSSKYCLTGPLFLVYALVLSSLFKILAPVIVAAFNSSSTGAAFEPFDDFPVRYVLVLFLSGHILFFIGAIVFRGFAVVKTAFCLFILPYTFFFMTWLSLKVFYFDYFDRFFSMETNRQILPGIQVLLLRSDMFVTLVWIMLYLWFVRMAYTCLKDHEA